MSSTNHTTKVGEKRKRSDEEEIPLQSPTPGIKSTALPTSNSKRVPSHKHATSEKVNLKVSLIIYRREREDMILQLQRTS